MKSSKSKEIKKICDEFGLNKRQYRDYKKIYNSLPHSDKESYTENLRHILTELRKQYGNI